MKLAVAATTFWGFGGQLEYLRHVMEETYNE